MQTKKTITFSQQTCESQQNLSVDIIIIITTIAVIPSRISLTDNNTRQLVCEDPGA